MTDAVGQPHPSHDGGAQLVGTVWSSLTAPLDAGSYAWIPCGHGTTCPLAAFVRKQLDVPEERLHALVCRRAGMTRATTNPSLRLG
jgi:hypothetical protein